MKININILKKIIYIILLFFSINYVNASIKICDWGDDLDITCKNWALIDDIKKVNSFSWNYTDFEKLFFGTKLNLKDKIDFTYSTPIWFFWINFNNKKDLEKTSYSTPVWYFGMSFTKNEERLDMQYITPVWFFGMYKWKNVDFPKLLELKKDLTNKEAINILLDSNLWDNEIKNKLYYLFPELNLSEILNYSNATLLFSNINWGIIIQNSELSFNLFKKLGIIEQSKKINEEISKKDFLEISSKINLRTNLRNDILYNIDDVFILDKDLIVKDIYFIYYLNKELKNLKQINNSNYLELKSCFELNWCNNVSLYLEYREKIEKLVVLSDISKLWVNIIWEISLEDYMKILFSIFWKEGYDKWWYDVYEYQNFIDILVESIIYKEDFEDMKFLNYNRFKLISIDLDLERLINILLKYREEIIKIYDEIDDKSRLFEILRKYLF